MPEVVEGSVLDWRPIEEIPAEMLDGRPVWVKRMSPNNPGSVVSEGWAVFGVCHENAPQRQSLGLDPLGRLTAADYAREARQTAENASRAQWLKPDRMYSFPTPTHWRPYRLKGPSHD